MAILLSRVGWCIESNALEKSIAKAAVRVAGLFWLKPVAIAVVSGRSAVVVECSGRKPCCVRFGVREALRVGKIRRSSTLEAAHRSEMDLRTLSPLPACQV